MPSLLARVRSRTRRLFRLKRTHIPEGNQDSAWRHHLGRLSRAASDWLDGRPLNQSTDQYALILPRAPSLPMRRKEKRRFLRYFPILRRNKLNSSQRPSEESAREEHDDGSSKSTISKNSITQDRPPLRFIAIPPAPSTKRVVQAREVEYRATKGDDFAAVFVSNRVCTAKYTMLTFLPKNLGEQFRRVANIYFAILVILQAIPVLSNFSPALASLPLLIILGATAAKDGIEDWRRHRADDTVNYALTTRLLRPNDTEQTRHRKSLWHRPRWLKRLLGTKKPCSRETQNGALDWLNNLTMIVNKKCRRILFWMSSEQSESQEQRGPPEERVATWRDTFWQDLRPGDVVLVKKDQAVPADLVLFSASDADGQAYVETQNLDGETNLKLRTAPLRTRWIKNAHDAALFRAILEVDLPTSNLYAFSGRMLITKDLEQCTECSQLNCECSDDEGTSGIAFQKHEKLEPDDDPPLHADIFPLGSEELLLRGCVLRNTEWAIGAVVYTGGDTKIMQNAGLTPSKRSRIERQMNPQIILCFIILFAACLACAVLQGKLVASSVSSAPYWGAVFGARVFASGWISGFLTFWSCLLLFQTLVPISLYLTVEMCKTVQAYLIHADAELRDPITNRPCVPRTWNLSDDLGRVDYIFADKTGTLTCNVMRFRKCSIGGRVYGKVGWTLDEEDHQNELLRQRMVDYVPPMEHAFVDKELIKDAFQPDVIFFFTILCTCHTVLIIQRSQDPESPKDVFEYKAQSPDEAALVEAARDLGFIFLHRDLNRLTISFQGHERHFVLLQVIEFTSSRKRMSVIVRDELNGGIWLFCKGADNVILGRLASNRDEDAEQSPVTMIGSNEKDIEEESPDCQDYSDRVEIRTKTLEHLQAFAEQGLRTLCFAAKRLSEEEYHAWSIRYQAAICGHPQERELQMEALADEVEQRMFLVGATAIEDRLQEGVPETIEQLQLADIRVWVLTGDKLETAINVGFACRLLRRSFYLMTIHGESMESTGKQLELAKEKIDQELKSDALKFHGNPFALIIDGEALKHALDDKYRQLFVEVAEKCIAVICCRVGPLQKAQVVALMRRARNVTALAIGDGANDVSMLQAADIGVGIAGQEGMQAVMSSDYAITRFAHLSRLVLVHGRWSFLRTSGATLASFYKNFCFVGVQVCFQWACAFTAQASYDYLYLLLYNALFSVLPVLALGTTDRDIEASDALRYPRLYRCPRTRYSVWLFCVELGEAAWQTACCYAISSWAFRDAPRESLLAVGNVQALTVILMVNATILCMSHHWNIITASAIILSISLLLVILVVYSLVAGPNNSLWGTWGMLLDWRTLLTFLLVFAVGIAPRILWKFIRSELFPTPLDVFFGTKKYSNIEAQEFNVDQRNGCDDKRQHHHAIIDAHNAFGKSTVEGICTTPFNESEIISEPSPVMLASRLSGSASRRLRPVFSWKGLEMRLSSSLDIIAPGTSGIYSGTQNSPINDENGGQSSSSWLTSKLGSPFKRQRQSKSQSQQQQYRRTPPLVSPNLIVANGKRHTTTIPSGLTILDLSANAHSPFGGFAFSSAPGLRERLLGLGTDTRSPKSQEDANPVTPSDMEIFDPKMYTG